MTAGGGVPLPGAGPSVRGRRPEVRRRTSSSLPLGVAEPPGGRRLMADDGDLRRDLVRRIEARRAAVQAFLRAHRPRTRRRANIIIICSSLSALFTAGPAF